MAKTTKNASLGVISVKPFLNKNLCAQILENGKLSYPLYYQVTFERRNTQLKSNFNTYLINLEDLTSEMEEIIRMETRILKMVVRHKKNLLGHAFSFVGLRTDYEKYIQSCDSVFQKYLKRKLNKSISLTHSELQNILKFDGFNSDFLMLYKAARKLFDNIENYIDKDFKEEIECYKVYRKCFPVQDSFEWKHITAIEWCADDTKEMVRHKLDIYFDFDKSKGVKTYKCLDQMIHAQLKYFESN